MTPKICQPLKCCKCGHEWFPRQPEPLVCANPQCRTRYWKKPRTFTERTIATVTAMLEKKEAK